jgi:hypothetical protein
MAVPSHWRTPAAQLLAAPSAGVLNQECAPLPVDVRGDSFAVLFNRR